MINKRLNVIEWNEYFMSIARVVSLRSKDPHTQVGCVLIDENKHIVGTGYNGLPVGLSDDNYPWDREGSILDVKYTYVIHAEMNAILNLNATTKPVKAYSTLFPCSGCAKSLIQKGIKEIFYIDNFYENTDDNKAALKMLTDAKVKLTKLSNIQVNITH